MTPTPTAILASPFHGEFTVTQSFSYTHNGLDLYAQDSPAVHAVTNGEVIFVGVKPNGLGTQVLVEDECKRIWYYGHLASTTVRQSDYVHMGDTLGIQGSTGNSRGDHLHLACKGRNGYENPALILNIPTTIGEPLHYSPAVIAPAIVLSQSPKQIKATIAINGIEYKGTLRAKGGE